jgi:GDP-4-dehydro-6-deoxy-D-mannose reductase
VRALVTGAHGFVGRWLCDHLRAAGDDVMETDHHHVDILDAQAVHGLVADSRADAVYHLAGFADVGASWDRPVDAFRVNADGTLHLLLACRDAGVGRVLVVSSADVYGAVAEDELPITEDAPLRPSSPYAASKVAADFLALQAHLGWGLGTVRARAFNHLGPAQTDRFVASALAARIARNEVEGHDVVPVGNLSPRRDFTDVRDVVRAYRLLVVRGEAGEVYNVCSGREVAIAELAARLLAMATRPMRLETDPALERPVDVPVHRGDCGRIRKATGWEPEVPLDDTLADLLDDWRRRLRTL